MLDNIIFVLLNITCVFIVWFIVKILKMNDKTRVHNLGLTVLLLDFIWASGVLLQVYIKSIFGHTFYPLVYYYAIGLYFVPFFSLFFIITFVKPETKFNLLFKSLLVVPSVFYILILTNNYHHLIYVKYDIDEKVIFGPAMAISGYYSIILHAIIFGYLIYYLCNNFKLFFKQAIIIGIGFFIPFFVNLLIIFDAVRLPLYANATSVSIALLVVYYGMTKYDILEINPISLRIILDSISDLFIVLDKNLNVIGYNKAFESRFHYLGLVAGNNFVNKLESNDLNNYLFNSLKNRSINRFQVEIKGFNSEIFIFEVEIIPIISDKLSIGLIVIFKDITKLHRMQEILVLKERHASLGILIGGIMHSIKSPLMAISADINTIVNLVREYKSSITDNSVTTSDHEEIATEMENWLNKTNETLEYISKILNYVRNQIQYTKDEEQFIVHDLIEALNHAIKYEQNHKCIFNINNMVDNDLKIKGSISLLTQVLNHLIINSIYSYNGTNGIIDFKIAKNDDNILFTVKDYGSGISKDLQSKLFHEMITTKGKDGTGLGLYISYSIVKSQFKGDIWFESEPGSGTAFYVSIPILREV